MSRIGYYRVKIKPSELTTIVNIYNGSILYASATVKARTYRGACSGGNSNGIYVKYLDQYGRYRFWMFNDKWKDTIKPRSIGTKTNLIESLRTAQSQIRSIGTKQKRYLSLRTENVSNEERMILRDIFVSPRVYARLDTGDALGDWLLCSEVKGDNTMIDNDIKSSRFEVELRLPDYYSVTDL